MNLNINCKLWSINKWLRWTGFRLYVSVQDALIVREKNPTRIGLRFFGWKDIL